MKSEAEYQNIVQQNCSRYKKNKSEFGMWKH